MGAQPESEQVAMEVRKDTWHDRLVPRPATGETPVSNFRIPKHIVQAAKAKAQAEGRTLTDVIVAYLRRYVSTPPRKKSDADD
jgi:NRPS condensation-like uncharacterized protein